MPRKILLFETPEDQDAYNAAVEGKQLREIIESLDNYLSIYHPDNRVKVSSVRQFLHRRISFMNLKCLKIREEAKTEDDGDPLPNCIRPE